jgi:ABC-type bacteriocin/lantibiotic exporter with double-glycine peptidase domain
MSKRERLKFYTFLTFRALVALFDLAGILAIGFLATAMALLLTEGVSPNRNIRIGSISLSAISINSLPVVVSVILLLFISKAIVSIILTRQLAHFLATIEARAARVIAKSAFDRGLEEARLNSRDEVIFAVQSGSPAAFNTILNSVGTLTAETFLFLLVLIAFATVDPGLALAAIVYFGFIGLLIQIFVGRLMQKTSNKMAKSVVAANTTLSDLGEVLRESVIQGKQEYFFNKIYDLRMSASSSNATVFVLSGLPRYIIETALIVAIALFALVQALVGDLVASAGTLGIFLSGGLRLTASLLPLHGALLMIRAALPEAVRALDLIEYSPKKCNPSSVLEVAMPLTEALEIELKKVDFKYDSSSSLALTGVSLHIPPGAQAAIIGMSGAGKSTLADLTLGLLEPTRGEVLVGGVSPKQLSTLHHGILGYVPQKPGMISGSIADNIALGVEVACRDTELMLKAISDAHLDSLINSLPEGANSDLGKRKDELSGGQLQRIGLARALYTQPKVLVLDEATSALDAESENEINKALDQMRGKVTVILIAHRLNTIQRSDIVFFIEDGKVVDSGTFKALTKSNKKVSRLARLMSIKEQE